MASNGVYIVRIRARCAGVFLAFLLFSSAAVADPAGHVAAVEGRVTAQRGDGMARDLALQAPVHVGETVRTEPAAKVQLLLLDGTTLSLGENSELALDAYVFDAQQQEGNAALRFARGALRSITGRITEAHPERFQIRTGKAVIGVRGCDLLLDVTEDEERIYVLELPRARAIVFKLLAEPSRRPRSTRPDRPVRIERAGRVMHLREDGWHREQRFLPQDIRGLIEATTVDLEPMARVTQGELARLLVERLGLWRVLGPDPTDGQRFLVLMAAGITPTEKGWQQDEPVTKAMLARVLVQALGANAAVPADRRDDPDAWINALRDLLEDVGLIETVEGAVRVLSHDEGILSIVEWFLLPTDELRRQHIAISRIGRILADLPRPTIRRPRPVTPDMPDGTSLR